jgi:hypothetical protein
VAATPIAVRRRVLERAVRGVLGLLVTWDLQLRGDAYPLKTPPAAEMWSPDYHQFGTNLKSCLAKVRR